MIEQIVVAGGCFWGMEELFRAQVGVVDTEVGYTGGSNDHPTYEHHPGHAEALRISYDPSQTTLATLLDYFFRIHDPTTVNRQGNDVGESYRSAIFYADDVQQDAATQAIGRAQPRWDGAIVTSLEPLTQFYSAEEYHQDYLQKHPGGYTCHYERTFVSDM
ncbi:Peptide methionine sulfoxide reductase MsrA [Candidatus Saccharimonas aalborgensis]|jgi:peptide-methionine (S)-S-oxide reductase|uniref:Peptide methionine sulfoxide reductase MsrA n=1 Tax=Candidatus Saccharimonas aalborgensis TaxID=1332188 RepID=R4PK80_9BACT|nr:peptide-methionine (S)-S-oxide reductase MsrA [Candidatus Saccharimonas aalborgensis]MBP7775002.1 peptide-methionine (S)-S-oxide reductase MsrA [Candidatus Saccharimonas sp.]QQR51740.1 MAG: peptide-methionine (S)-S-oxide reductase MsrA [Candidatus Saccharibacteria bacterium]AGL61938.1 Peptide methionine sulfoxide reductase MsrA [Candidatus Saccharimonas aalborgensis]QQS68470.1 MAG: peptide-methionine (S)-S-oxide reductase MsrA [Candidatus Saccharibacteria bacterium]QQS70761.1 MAG: peptide-m